MPDQKIIEDRYLADGVYASYDGMYIWLDLRGQQRMGEPRVRIALDDQALGALERFSEDVAEALADAAVKRIAEANRVTKSKEPSHGETPNDTGS